jgi:hypothetical protein
MVERQERTSRDHRDKVHLIFKHAQGRHMRLRRTHVGESHRSSPPVTSSPLCLGKDRVVERFIPCSQVNAHRIGIMAAAPFTPVQSAGEPQQLNRVQATRVPCHIITVTAEWVLWSRAANIRFSVRTEELGGCWSMILLTWGLQLSRNGTRGARNVWAV